MDKHILDAAEEKVSPLNLAGFRTRGKAAVADFCLLYLFYMLLGDFVDGLTGLNFELSFLGVPFTASYLMFSILYYSLFESSPLQGTPGKLLVGASVGDKQNHRLGLHQAFGRCLASYLSLFLFGLGYLMVVWDKRKQALHDRIANTFVFVKAESLTDNPIRS